LKSSPSRHGDVDHIAGLFFASEAGCAKERQCFGESQLGQPLNLRWSSKIFDAEIHEDFVEEITITIVEKTHMKSTSFQVGIVMLILPFGYLHLAQALWQNIAAAAA